MPKFENQGTLENIVIDAVVRQIVEALQGESLTSTKSMLDLLLFVVNDWSYGYFYDWLVERKSLPKIPQCPSKGELVGSFNQSPRRVIYKTIYLTVIQLLLGKLLLNESVSSNMKRFLIDHIVVSIGDEFYYCYFAEKLELEPEASK